jgi:hypothetical protein
MKVFGWMVLIAGLLGCIWAGLLGTLGGETNGIGAIGVAIAAVGGVFAGIKLVERSGK